MTVNTITPEVEYNEDGATLAFAVPFSFLDPQDLIVDRRPGPVGTVFITLTRGIHYTISGGNGEPGQVLLTGSAAGQLLRIRRFTPRVQNMDYTAFDEFPAESHERQLDRAIMIIQELAAQVQDIYNRGLFFPPGEEGFTFPPAAERTNSFFYFGPDGAPVLLTLEQLVGMLTGVGGDYANSLPGILERLAELEAGRSYIFGSFAAAQILANEILLEHQVVDAHTLAANFAGCSIELTTPPAAQWVATVWNDATQIGTITIEANGTITLATTGGLAKPIADDSFVRVQAPAVADAAIAGFRFTFKGALS